jgi:tight adherence protein B
VRRRHLRFPTGFATATLAAMLLASAASAASLHASFGNAGRFPARALVASAPARYGLTARTVHVQENGTAANDVSVTPLSTARRGDFGVILVIDVSQSMRGQPLRQAMLAARTLAAERTGKQELGVIEFNSSTSVVLPLTGDKIKIAAALAQEPKLGFGSRIYDATLQAIQQLHRGGVVAATVVVLSDGADVASRVTQQAVADAAAADHVRVYTVGVKDRSFNARTLATLARATGGSYTGADAAGLRQVFTRIESQLTTRYLVRYRSPERLGRRIHVTLWIDGIPGRWTGTYATAPSPLPAAGGRPRLSHRPAGSFWASTLALVLVSFGGALLLVGGLLAHVVPRTRQDELRLRIGEFVRSETSEAPPEPATPGTDERADRWLSQSAWWSRFKEEVDVAAIERSPVRLVSLTLMASLTIALALSLFAASAVVSVPVLIAGPIVMSAIVHHRANRQRHLFADQLPAHLEEIGSAMRGGHSVAAAIASVAKDCLDPARRELERAVADERLGVPIDAALRPIARRMRCSDIDQLALVAALNARSGGSMGEVLDLIANAARERLDLRRELQALTAQARLSRWIVSLLPPAILAILALIAPSYIHPLFHTLAGLIVLLIATGLVLAGSTVMRMLVPNEE